MNPRPLLALSLVVTTACNNTPEPSGLSATSPTSATAPTTSGESGDSTGGESTAETASTGGGSGSEGTTGAVTSGPKLDLGMPDFGGDTGTEGCTKVDFLFVVDNSNSMSAEQDLLTAAFPGFIAAIQAALPDAADYHVGVTKTDIFGFDNEPTPDPANPCPYRLGGLISHATPDGQKTGTGPSCGFASGQNYMTAGPTLSAEFACAAEVGTKGNTGERQADATLAALDPTNDCSAGFLRDDALLVLTLITDEDDDESAPDSDVATNAQAWFDALVAAKGGIETNVVFLLISGGSPRWPDCKDISPEDFSGAAASPKLTAWAEKFSNAHFGDVCAPGYADGLAAAIATIQVACEQFTPPG